MGESRRTSSGKRQPIVIRHLLTTKPYLRSEATGSLEEIPRTSSRSGSVSLEKEMDSSVEDLFREWDPGLHGKRRRDRHSVIRQRDPRTRSECSVESGLASMRKDDLLSFDSSDELFEESSLRRPLYVDCAETGQRRFRMEFDAEGFSEENISLTLSGSRLEIHALQEETDGGRKSTSEFSRRIRLPSDVDGRRLSCFLVDGKVLIEAPLLLQQGSPRLTSHNNPASASATSSVHPASDSLNVPVISEHDGAKILTLIIEVGRVFRSDDIVVKLRNPSKVLVTAERFEVTDSSRLSASLLREFDLPAKIDSQTLKAGLTLHGLLKVTANLLPEDEQDRSAAPDENNRSPKK